MSVEAILMHFETMFACEIRLIVQAFHVAVCKRVSNAITRGIKHDFPFINICKVPREVLKTEDEARGFQPSRGTLRMLMNDKIMFDRYYCINSANHCENEENIGALYFINSSHFPTRTLLKTMHDSGTVQILIILHVLCVAPGNKHN